MKELIRRSAQPEVLFSPIKSAARVEDKCPPAVVAWTSAESLDGMPFSLPPASLVTSRFDLMSPKSTHYALVCYSRQSLLTESPLNERIVFGQLRNILTGRPVGASQVTSIIERSVQSHIGTRTYDVTIRALLVEPFLVRLREPRLVANPDGSCMAQTPDWDAAVRQLWERRMAHALQLPLQGL